MHALLRMPGYTAIVLLLAQALLPGCAVKSSPQLPVVSLPLNMHTQTLGIRAESRALTLHSVTITVYLAAKTEMSDVRVSIEPGESMLAVTPKVCRFEVLSPPTVGHASHTPYPAPTVPLCSFVLSANVGGTYPATLRVQDFAGNDLVTPTNLAVAIKGESP